MEEQYLATVAKHAKGKPGHRGCDSIKELFHQSIAMMEETRGEMIDVLGDLFQGSITYGENGQFFSPPAITRMMGQMTVGEVPEDERHEVKSVYDPACGSGRMLLAVAEQCPHWLVVGKDTDLRCVRLTALNLALRNLYGYVIHGNSLTGEEWLVYRTGFNGFGFIQEVKPNDCPEPVRTAATEAHESSEAMPPTNETDSEPAAQTEQPQLTSDPSQTRPRNQLRLF